MAQRKAPALDLPVEATNPIDFSITRLGKSPHFEIKPRQGFGLNEIPNEHYFNETVPYNFPEYEFASWKPLLDAESYLHQSSLPQEQTQWGRELFIPSFYALEPSQLFEAVPKASQLSGEAHSSTSLLRAPGKLNEFVRGNSKNVPFLPGGVKEPTRTPELDFVLDEKELDFSSITLKHIPPGFEFGFDFHAKDSRQTSESLVNLNQISQNSVKLSGSKPEIATGQYQISEDEQAISQAMFDSKPSAESSLVVKFHSVFKDDGEDLFGSSSEEEEEGEYDSDASSLDETEPTESPSGPPSESKQESATSSDSFKKEREGDALEEILETITEYQQNKPVPRKASKPKRIKQWGRQLDMNMENFHELVPNMAIQYPFELDTFQKEAIYHLERGESVFVAAHTSAGKTVVAEYAIALAKKHMTRTIYTSPIKALSNQKFRDFKNTFGEVGLITGDVQINPEASCLIVTTEILRSMLYKGADLLRDVEWVIFDEVHYVNDIERGVVWEEVIILLPARVNIILLSATVPNCLEFADWIGRTKQKKIFVVSTLKRPTPLEHYLCTNNELYKIVDKDRNFLDRGINDATNSLNESKKKSKAAQTGYRPPAGKGEKSYWNKIIHLLNKRQLTPVVIFAFSKKKCETLADSLPNMDLTSGAEKSEIHVFMQNSISKLKGPDQHLPQVLRIKDLLRRGIGVHHGGLLPIIKEMVEILFARGLCRVLFATETFAMGVNMPARTVVFQSIRKHDGQTFRDLLPGEYIQMSGRAGRRGLDAVGVVIINAWEDIPDVTGLHAMTLGSVGKLESQFRLTYNMILNLLRVQDFRVEDMMMRSFFEVDTQREAPEKLDLLSKATNALKDVEDIDCIFGTPDSILEFYQLHAHVKLLSNDLQQEIQRNKSALQVLSRGRVVQISLRGYRNSFGAIVGISSRASILASQANADPGQASNVKQFDLIVPSAVENLLQLQEGGLARFQIISVPLSAITNIFQIKLTFDALEVGNEVAMSKVVSELNRLREKHAVTPLAICTPKDFKINSLDFVEKYSNKQDKVLQMNRNQCSNCPKLNEHFVLIDKQQRLKHKINELQFSLSEENLYLMPEFQKRMVVLQRLNYVDQNKTVQLKGRVSRELNTVIDELIATELIFQNRLAELEPEEIVSVLSTMIFQEKFASDPVLTENLQNAWNGLVAMAQKLGEIQMECGLDTPAVEYSRKLNYHLMEVVYQWARGMPFAEICNLTDVLEGSIVRCIVRLEETCREFKSAARIIGNTSLQAKMDRASELIKRDIVFASSLYVV